MPNLTDIGVMIRDLQDFAKRPKILKAMQSLSEGKHDSMKALSGIAHVNLGFRSPIRDFHDIEIPKRQADFPKSVLKLLALEKTKHRRKMRKCYIPVTHVLE